MVYNLVVAFALFGGKWMEFVTAKTHIILTQVWFPYPQYGSYGESFCH